MKLRPRRSRGSDEGANSGDLPSKGLLERSNDDDEPRQDEQGGSKIDSTNGDGRDDDYEEEGRDGEEEDEAEEEGEESWEEEEVTARAREASTARGGESEEEDDEEVRNKEQEETPTPSTSSKKKKKSSSLPSTASSVRTSTKSSQVSTTVRPRPPASGIIKVDKGPFFPGMSLDTGLPKPNYFTFKNGRTMVNGSAAPVKSNLTKAMQESKARREHAAHKQAAKEQQQPKVNPAKSGVPQSVLSASYVSSQADADRAKDIKLIMMRGALDPKRFYKTLAPIAKTAQIGTVIEGPTEYFSARLTKKQRKQTIVDEILADKQLRDYAKRKFVEVAEAGKRGEKGEHKAKQMKKRPKWARG